MHRSIKQAIGALCLAWVGVIRCVAQSPIAIPGPNSGYEISKSDSSEAAPAGYEGRTDTSIQTAVGNTPATTGRKIVAKFRLGNQVRTCPHADGVAEGEGIFSVSVDYTDAQANGTATIHIEMSTRGKYKGQVGDNALLQGPVNGEFDYTYTQTGTLRGQGAGLLSTASPVVQQHFSVPIPVMPDMKPPDMGAFSGGDPAQAHYGDALGASMALAYWAGVYYSIAEMKWYGGETSGGGTSVRAGQCVVIAFDPPSYTLQPPLGAKADVKAVAKTKSGEVVAAQFVEAHAYSGGTVAPAQGQANGPLKFVYTAPNQKTKSAGFGVAALSRAGTATADWHTGLGTGWSGEITYEKTFTGDDGGTPGIQQWSNSSRESVTVTVENGVATYHGHVESKGHLISYHPVAKSGPAFDYGDDSEENGDGEFPARVEVSIDESRGSYGILIGPALMADGRPKAAWGPIGKAHSVSCRHDAGCQTYDRDVGMPTIGLSGPLSGKLQDPNHIQATYTDQRTEQGRSHKGVIVETTTVNLARSGTTNRSGGSKNGGS